MSLEGFDKLKGLLTLRKQAFQQVFNPNSVYAQRVIRDLAKFCRANATTFHQDARMHAVLEGRREVWLRIEQHLRLTPDELLKILGGN